MKFGVISVPYALDYAAGKETVRDVIDWDMQVAKWADSYGIDEMFFAEHYTLGHEAGPAPDLMIAAASQVTTTLRLGAMGHLLPYHNPVALAHRMMWLDHMTGGRYIAGIAPGAFPSDAQLFGTGSNNGAMMAEGIDIMMSVFTKPGPWEIDGKFWTASMPEYTDALHGPHLKPLQQPHPEIMMTGMQENSPTLREAGLRGFSPVSQEVNTDALKTHWATYAEAAAEAGYTPDRNNWRIGRDLHVAETDEQAREEVLAGPIGRTWAEHNLPLFKRLGLGPLVCGSALRSEDDLSVEWMIDNIFLVGSPDTVIEKTRALYDEVGGFGAVFCPSHGRGAEPERYRKSLELLGTRVAPKLVDLKPIQ
jgi:alkanesulfonate monooxygenase SsuD/methylene tetrahydromethanopterin reductase-like flavin-dependent oxidoreductase (luciferase family)